MGKFTKTAAIILFLFLISMTFLGCIRKTPHDEFQSLQELKDSLNSDSRIIFPDLAGYEYDKNYPQYWKVYRGKSNVIQGYNIGSKLDPAKSESNLWSLIFTCRLLDTTYDKSNPEPALNANMKVSGIDVSEGIVDTPNDPHTNLYPEGSRNISIGYAFDSDGCRYNVAGNLLIPPDKLKSLDDREIDALIEDSKKELLVFVKSIIGKE